MSPDALIYVLYAIPALLVAISLHEMMHSVVGYWLGDDTAKVMGRISFNPLKHIDPITTVALPLMLVLLGLPPFAAAKPVPVNFARLKWEEFGMALVAIAGPLTNLLLGIFSVLLLKIVDPVMLQTVADGSILRDTNFISGFLAFSVLMNFGLFIFNLIPFPPLDGSRVLYAFAPEPLQRLMEQVERMGFAAIIFFMFVIFPFIGQFIFSINRSLIGFFSGA